MSDPTLTLADYLSPLPVRPTVTEALIQQILSLIRKAALRPGDRLPSEKEIIEATNASRPSVREALRALKTMGIIETRPGAGSFLRQVQPSGLIRPEMISLALIGDGLHDILETRKILECHVARCAAQCSQDELAQLGAVLDMPQALLTLSQDVFELTWEFHVRLAEIGGNPVIAKLIRILYEMISEIELKLYWPYIDLRVEVERHRELYRAILCGADEADQAMRSHIDYIATVVERAVASQAQEGRDR